MPEALARRWESPQTCATDRIALHARALHRHPRLAALFFGAVAPAVVLGLRVSVGPAVVPATVRGWMTTNYVARAYGIDRDARAAVLGTEPGRLQGLTLCEITQALGRSEADIIAAIESLHAGVGP